MTPEEFHVHAADISSILNLKNAPLGITFSQEAPAGIDNFIDDPMPEPTTDGRTGRVPAGCVFWIKAQNRTFTTVAEDHGNCSVGSMTHGFKKVEEVVNNSDIACLVDANWVTPDMFPHIPVVRSAPKYVTYGPLYETTIEPDIVFLRLNAKQAMILSDAVPETIFQGKPQCHIVAIAMEQNQVAISVGCMLSRVRTGIPSTEMTCVIPAKRLTEVIEKLQGACKADKAVATYASEDSKRFGDYLA